MRTKENSFFGTKKNEKKERGTRTGLHLSNALPEVELLPYKRQEVVFTENEMTVRH